MTFFNPFVGSSSGSGSSGGGTGSDGKSAYEVAVDNGFSGTQTEWLASLKGVDGADGKDGNGIKSILFVSSTGGSTAGISGATDTYKILYTDGTSTTFKVVNGKDSQILLAIDDTASYIRVSYDGGKTWENLLSIESIKGQDGLNGSTPILRENGDYIEVSYDGVEWEPLIDLSYLKGEKGDKGDKGEDGEDGISITGATVNADGHLIITLSTGDTVDSGYVKGADGTSVVIKASKDECTDAGDGYIDENGHLQIKTDTGDFVDAGEIKGPAGRGIANLFIGDDGHLYVLYDDEEIAQDLGNVQGPQGEQGEKGEKGEKGDDGKSIEIGTVIAEAVSSSESPEVSVVLSSSTDDNNTYDFSFKIPSGENGYSPTIEVFKQAGVWRINNSKAPLAYFEIDGDATTQPTEFDLTGLTTVSLINWWASTTDNLSVQVDFYKSDLLVDSQTFDMTLEVEYKFNVENYDKLVLQTTGSAYATGQIIYNDETSESGYFLKITYKDGDTIKSFLTESLRGSTGLDGKTAYETWLDLGNEGTEQEFIDYLKNNLIVIETTLQSSMWSEDGTYTITNTNINTDSVVHIGVQEDISETVYDVLAAAKIICQEQSNNTIILKAYGTIPEIDIPIVITIEDSTK